MAARRTSTGRKKIEIKRIESEEARAVCFSKRRKGLFNKLSELSTLCGAEVAALVFSPGGKAFTFGHPSVESVIDRVYTFNSSEAQAAAAVDGGDGDRNLAVAELNREFGELRARVTAIKARNKAVDAYFAKARAEGCQVAAWLEPDIDVSKMADDDLAAFLAALEKVRSDVAARTNQVLLQEALLFGRPVHGGGGEFELGGTSAIGGMKITQQQMMMMLEMAPPMGFAAGTEMMQQQQMMMAMPLPPMGFDTGTEMQQQQQQMMPPTGFEAGMEMMQQQQQQLMAIPPPPTGFASGMETMQQQQQQTMMTMPPLPGFSTGMEKLHQGFGYDFPQ